MTEEKTVLLKEGTNIWLWNPGIGEHKTFNIYNTYLKNTLSGV